MTVESELKAQPVNDDDSEGPGPTDLCTYRDKRDGVVRLAGESGQHGYGPARRIVPLLDATQYLLVTFQMCRECGAYLDESITAEVRTVRQRIRKDR